MEYKVLTDEHGEAYVAMYERGKFSKPLVLITQFEMEKLVKSWKEFEERNEK